jgi:hypothetical protein
MAGRPLHPPPWVAQAFQPVRPTGKMPAPPSTFQGKGKIVLVTQIAFSPILAKIADFDSFNRSP